MNRAVETASNVKEFGKWNGFVHGCFLVRYCLNQDTQDVRIFQDKIPISFVVG